MSDQGVSLLLRQEDRGKSYPLWIERLLMATFLVSLVFIPSQILERVDGGIGLATAWCLYPIVAVSVIELIGRFIQSR
jgi:hypothetical protein